MTSIRINSAVLLVSAVLVNTGLAQFPPGAAPYGVQQASGGYPAGVPPYQGAPGYGQYPQLGAPLYPSPVQNTPPWTGTTMITNQALAPHEMLYPHTYHAMYPPFYYKVRGGWVWTPFGMRQHENWKLEGTEVLVKYRSHIPLLNGYSFRPHFLY